MRKSIYLLTTTPSSHTHRFHPLPLYRHTHLLLTTPTSHTHTFHPLSTIVIHTCGKFKVWMTIVESGWNVWVWLVGVVSRRWVCLYSGSGWNLWVWLLGVVVRRYIDFLILLIPTPLVSVLFYSIPTFYSFFLMFFVLYVI